MNVFTANLRGSNHRPLDAQGLVLALEENAPLIIEREPENPYDVHAIKVLHPTDRVHIGYVAREVAKEIAPLMDVGHAVTCKCLVPGGKATVLEITVSGK